MNVVQKYGGTSLDSLDKVRAVAEHIASFRKEGDGIVIVASAMGGTKDELISQAKQLGDNIPKRELDALLATGISKIFPFTSEVCESIVASTTPVKCRLLIW